MTRFFLPAVAALILLAGGCDAQASNDKPALALTGRIVDAAGILDADVEASLAMLSADLEKVTGNQFVVVTAPSLNGRTVEAYTLDLANTWGVGRKNQNDGVVLLVAPKERKVRIEVGVGLEQRLTNAEARRIIDDRMLPAFHESRFPEGIEQGSKAIVLELIRK